MARRGCIERVVLKTTARGDRAEVDDFIALRAPVGAVAHETVREQVATLDFDAVPRNTDLHRPALSCLGADDCGRQTVEVCTSEA